MNEIEEGAWRRGDGSNLIGVPAGFFASVRFNEAALAVHLAGVRETNPDLFRLLAGAPSSDDASGMFTAYMRSMFGLDRPDDAPTSATPSRRRYRTSYLRLLRGWAYDSSSLEGAVLKGWVESRFGLYPTFHKVPLTRFGSAAWARYVEEKIGSKFHNNAIFAQLDLLYEFVQWVITRFQPDRRHWRLFRGVNDFSEHPIVERIDRRRVVLRLNNVVSFTSDRDVASCFGDRILEADVPVSKILFFNELLPGNPLKSESEVLVLGGDFLVRATYY